MKTKVENKTEGKRTCRKCLLYEMDQGDYFRNLYAYIDRLDPDIKAGEKLYRDRLSICKECELLLDGMCRTCGCFVELRAAVKENICPYERW